MSNNLQVQATNDVALHIVDLKHVFAVLLKIEEPLRDNIPMGKGMERALHMG